MEVPDSRLKFLPGAFIDSGAHSAKIFTPGAMMSGWTMRRGHSSEKAVEFLQQRCIHHLLCNARLTLMMSGLIGLGPREEKLATSGAGFVRGPFTWVVTLVKTMVGDLQATIKHHDDQDWQELSPLLQH